jgi:hypothetical protein
MHGADMRRKMTFAVKVRVSIPPEATIERAATAGVADTLIVTTPRPLIAEILELYVRQPGSGTAKNVKGRLEIAKFLKI